MKLLTNNPNVSALINAQKRPDGQIIEGVYIAMQYETSTKALINLFIGTKDSGPMLQYSEDGEGKYNGHGRDMEDSCFESGAWTTIYSHGNFGKNYAYGGNFSGHTKNLHPSIATTWRGTQEKEDIENEFIMVGNEPEYLPYGIKGEITETDLDCSGGWAIFYVTAQDALDNRLAVDEIQDGLLAEKTKRHLISSESDSILKLQELINLFNL